MRRQAITLTAVLLSSVSTAAAQRSGMWYGVGLAPGWARVTCDICAGARQSGISGYVTLGGYAGRALRIGAELAGWREREDGVTQSLMSVGAAALWYPNARRRFYLRGGAALVMHRATDGTEVITSSGFGPLLGVGYEYPLSRKWLAGPFLHYSIGAALGSVKFNGGEASNSATVSFLQTGLRLTRR